MITQPIFHWFKELIYPIPKLDCLVVDEEIKEIQSKLVYYNKIGVSFYTELYEWNEIKSILRSKDELAIIIKTKDNKVYCIVDFKDEDNLLDFYIDLKTVRLFTTHTQE